MGEFTCKRCSYRTVFRANMKKHLSRKYPCNGSLSNVSPKKLLNDLLRDNDASIYECSYCTKRFSSTYSQKRHITICKEKPSIIGHLEEKVEHLEHQLKQRNSYPLRQTTQNFIADNGSTMNILNCIVNMNSYDNPNLEKIQTPRVICMSKKKDRIERITKYIYFNDKIPENHSIYAPTTDTNDLKMHNGKTLRKVRHPDKAIKKIVETSIRVIQNCIKTNYQDYVDELEDECDDADPEILKKMEEDLNQIMTLAPDDPDLVPKYMKLFNENKDLVEKTRKL